MVLPKLSEFNPHKVISWAGALVRFLEEDRRTIDFGTATLIAAETVTVVSDQAIELGGDVFLQAKNVAAASLANVTTSNIVDGSFSIEHDAAAGGEIFSYLAVGPGGEA